MKLNDRQRKICKISWEFTKIMAFVLFIGYMVSVISFNNGRINMCEDMGGYYITHKIHGKYCEIGNDELTSYMQEHPFYIYENMEVQLIK